MKSNIKPPRYALLSVILSLRWDVLVLQLLTIRSRNMWLASIRAIRSPIAIEQYNPNIQRAAEPANHKRNPLPAVAANDRNVATNRSCNGSYQILSEFLDQDGV